tara:strand:- start:618 stop:848 length:231 start_codon:yes stop_codon:yes gene_type:complete
MKTKLNQELLKEILKTTEEIRQMQNKIKTSADDISTKLEKEILELELIQNPSETLLKYIISARHLLREIQRIPKRL